jgi:hypothetical protein
MGGKLESIAFLLIVKKREFYKEETMEEEGGHLKK